MLGFGMYTILRCFQNVFLFSASFSLPSRFCRGWLDSIELGAHVESFKTHSVNGKMLLALSDQDLYSTLGVTSPLHRKKLLMEISALRKSYLS